MSSTRRILRACNNTPLCCPWFCYGEPPPLSGLSRPSGPNVPPSLNRPIYHPPSIFATSTPSHCKGEIRVGRRESRFESRVEKRERLSVSRRLLIQVLFSPQLSCSFVTKLPLRQQVVAAARFCQYFVADSSFAPAYRKRRPLPKFFFLLLLTNTWGT